MLSGRAIFIAGVVLSLISVMLLTNAVKSERELLTMDFKRVASAEISLKTSGEDMLISLSATEHGDYIKELYSTVLTDTENVKS